MLGDTPAVRATLAALMETGIRVSDVEIVRLTPGFTLDDRLQRFMETAARLGAGQVLVAMMTTFSAALTTSPSSPR